jgi:hypothetical protein
LDLFYYHPEWDGLCGIANSGSGNVSRWKWDKAPGKIDRYNVWRRCRSITIFLKKNVIEATGEFDNHIGFWDLEQCGIQVRKTDYILRTIKIGLNIQYFPEIIVNHPDDIPQFDLIEIAKGKNLGMVWGKYYANIIIHFGLFPQFLLPIGSLIKSLAKGNFHVFDFFIMFV